MKVIINADDLGYDLKTNKAIEDAIKKGCISSSTILANGQAVEDAVRIARQYPDISFGIHLNVVEFKPLTDNSIFRQYGIIDSLGNFLSGTISSMNAFPDDLKKALYEEWDAQISLIETFGIKLSHADSHQHIHMNPKLKDILAQVLTKHNITKVRKCDIPSIPLMIYGALSSSPDIQYKEKDVTVKRKPWLYRRLRLFVVISESYKWIRKLKKSFKMTDHFYGYLSFYNYKHILRFKNQRCVELMCHPGLDECEVETNLVMNKSIISPDVELISYNQL